jgi:YARHG domain
MLVRRLVGLVALVFVACGQVAAQAQPVETQLRINATLQDALIWTGHYDGLSDGSIGQRSITAIADFQRAIGQPASGDLATDQKLQLLKTADQQRQRMGFRLVEVPQVGFSVALPTAVVAWKNNKPNGSRYSSSDGKIEIVVSRFLATEQPFRGLYDGLLSLPAMRPVTMKVYRSDAFFVAGENENEDYYFTGRLEAGVIKGLAITTPRARRPELSRLIVAMSNAFHNSMHDYAAVAALITDRRAPEVAGYAKRVEPELASKLAGASCSELWMIRNTVFKDAGYCFQTERAQQQFGNAGCRHSNVSDVPLSERQKGIIEAIRAKEAGMSCSGEPAPQQTAASDPPRATAAPRNSMVPREQLLPVVHAVLGDAGITEYKILAPTANDAPMVNWVYSDGGYADLQALPPKSGAKIEDVANASISRSADACKGEFASARGQSRFHVGNEILKVETRCRANDGLTAVTYSVVELPSGVLLRFSHWTTGEPTPSEPKAERSLRVENAALKYISSTKSGLDR